MTTGYNQDAGFLARLSWAFYDWAAQPYFTVVLTFIFGPYFQNFVAPSVEKGQAWWGYTQAIAGLLLAISGPIVGTIADVRGRRKPWVLLANIMMVIGLCVTWLALPDGTAPIVLILSALIIASLGSEYGVIFTNAMLPGLAKPGQMGRLSGFGWGMGYLGGLAMLIIVLTQFALPEQPALGLDPLTHESDRIVGPLAALWLIVFSLPLFLFVPDGAKNPQAPGLYRAAKDGLRALYKMARTMPGFRNIGLFLIARMAYYDGVTAVYTFGGLYAAGTFDWALIELGVFGIILVVTGAIGVFIGGILDDKLGSKPTILLSIIGILVAVIGILSIERDVIFFTIHVDGAQEDDGLFASIAEQVMIGFGCLVGLFLGPVQSASRTMMARIAPENAMTACFGLYALTGRATVWVAPALIAIATDVSGSRRIGIAMILVLLVAGLALLLKVREERVSS